MRRIYYAYLLRLALNTPVLLAGALLATLVGLTRFVSVRAVAENLSSVRVGDVGHFLLDALAHTESWTLALLALALVLSALFIRELRTGTGPSGHVLMRV